MEKDPSKNSFHVLKVLKIVGAVVLLTAAVVRLNILPLSHARRENSLRIPNSVKSRILTEHTNVFFKSSSTFLVQWGTLQSGCRAPPVAHLLLECSGGELNVLRGGEDCVPTPLGGAECALPTEGVESNEHLWKQGMIVATCEHSENYFGDGAPVGFKASFAFEFATVCLGKPIDHLPKDLTEWPQGNFETFLEATQLCTSDGDDLQMLGPQECSSGTNKSVKLFDNVDTTVCRAVDTCTVADCSLLGPGFICPPSVLPCHVKPPPLIISHKGTGSCKEAGLEDIDSDHEFWGNVNHHQLSLTNLYEAGFGAGADYHL
jgi:hypothetical protein